MKYFAYILSIIVIVLTIIPCIDRPHDNSLAKSIITEQTNDTHQNDIDHCSPFCTCQCCQTSFHTPIDNSSSIAVFSINKYFSINEKFVNNFFYDFYIPPKA